MPHEVLQQPKVVALVAQGIAGAVAKHMRPDETGALLRRSACPAHGGLRRPGSLWDCEEPADEEDDQCRGNDYCNRDEDQALAWPSSHREA